MRISLFGNSNVNLNPQKFTKSKAKATNAAQPNFNGAKIGKKEIAIGATLAGIIASAAIGTTVASSNQTAKAAQSDDANSSLAATQATKAADSATSKFSGFNATDNVDVVSVISTDTEGNDVVLYNVLRVADDKFEGGYKNNSTTKVVKTYSNEANEVTTLREAINKQYFNSDNEPFKTNKENPGKVTDAEMNQIAWEIIENNEDMQKAIAKTYGKENWQQVPLENILDDSVYSWGINEFKTPDVVKIHGISDESPLYQKANTKTDLYSATAKTIKLDNSIKTEKDLYSAFAGVYKNAKGENANATASSVATWLTIRDNQYDNEFDGKINNDGDRTDRTVLNIIEDLSKLKDNEVLELDLPTSFGVNYVGSGGIKADEISGDQAYHIVHEMSPIDTRFELGANAKLASEEDTTKDFYNFQDIATIYRDPDTKRALANKIKTTDPDGNTIYILDFDEKVPDLNAKLYSLYEQFAYDHINFFASTQDIEIDNENKTYEFGVFDVQKGYEQTVKDAIAKGDYDKAKNYLKFNLERFTQGSFYNKDGSLKADKNVMEAHQYLYVKDGEGSEIKVTPKEPVIEEPTTETPSAPVVPSAPTEPQTKPSEPDTKPSEPETRPSEPNTKPTVPSSEPTDPSSEPTVPSSEPTEPSSEPTVPSSEPTEPSSEPTVPSSEPTEPSSEPTVPSSEPTDPSSEPTVPSSEPTEPSSEPTVPSSEPTEPSSEPTVPSSEPTEPSSEPTVPSSEPTEPSSEPTVPSSEPTEPSSEPTVPSSEPTVPSSEPTEPVTRPTDDPNIPVHTRPTKPTDPTDSTDPTVETDPTEPDTEPSEPTVPSSEPTDPSSEPTVPSSEPQTEPSEPTEPSTEETTCADEKDPVPDADPETTSEPATTAPATVAPTTEPDTTSEPEPTEQDTTPETEPTEPEETTPVTDEVPTDAPEEEPTCGDESDIIPDSDGSNNPFVESYDNDDNSAGDYPVEEEDPNNYDRNNTSSNNDMAVDVDALNKFRYFDNI